MAKRIGILTGGGDVPGLNSVIKEVVYRGTEEHYEVLGIRRGWEGLTHVNLDDPASREHYLRPLDRANTRTIDRFGGTILHTSRTNPSRMKKLPDFVSADSFPKSGSTWDMSSQVLANLDKLGIDHLITIGGDDTLSYSARLDKLGVKVIAIPKTMDNDVQGTEYCIGFSTAITRAKDAINRQRTTLGSHERIGIFRIFGRDAGFSALYASYVTSARCLIPEFKYDIDHLGELLVADRKSNPSQYAIAIVAEGAVWAGGEIKEVGEPDMFGHRHKQSVAEILADEIKARTGVEAVASELTYDLRSGDPDAIDQIVASTFANVAMDLIAEGQHGRMVAIRDGKYAHTQLPPKGLGPRTVDIATSYDTERYRPVYSGRLGQPLLLSTAVPEAAAIR